MMDNIELERLEALGSKVVGGKQYIVVKLGNEQFGIDIDIVDNIDEEYIKSTSPRENLSFNSNANNHEDSINDLSQIEKLLVEIKEHFNKENSNKSKSEQRIISIDLDEKENLKKGNNEDTPHFKKRISISDYLNGGSASEYK